MITTTQSSALIQFSNCYILHHLSCTCMQQSNADETFYIHLHRALIHLKAQLQLINSKQ